MDSCPLFSCKYRAEIEAVLAWAKKRSLIIVLVGGQNAWRWLPN